MRPGTVIAGFRVEEELGRGARGLLHVATQLSLGRTVALELIDAEPELASRLQRDAQLQAALHHPHVVPVYDAGQSEQGPFVARRLVRGRVEIEILVEIFADGHDAIGVRRARRCLGLGLGLDGERFGLGRRKPTVRASRLERRIRRLAVVRVPLELEDERLRVDRARLKI